MIHNYRLDQTCKDERTPARSMSQFNTVTWCVVRLIETCDVNHGYNGFSKSIEMENKNSKMQNNHTEIISLLGEINLSPSVAVKPSNQTHLHQTD